MDLADDTLLGRHNDARARGLPGIPFGELVEYMEQAARGLDYLNAPRHHPPSSDGRPVAFQHRDVKPQNLLLFGGGVKLGDWGLLRMLQAAVASHTGYMTPLYAAPEFFLGKTSSTSDQYSLAVTYCLLRTGCLPFRGDPRDAHLNRPPDLDHLADRKERLVVERALAKNPQERWPSSHDFAAALRECDRGSTTVHLVPAGPDPRAGAPPLNVPSFHLGSVVPPQHFIGRE
jgi:serine/threonine-protein kinase